MLLALFRIAWALSWPALLTLTASAALGLFVTFPFVYEAEAPFYAVMIDRLLFGAFLFVDGVVAPAMLALREMWAGFADVRVTRWSDVDFGAAQDAVPLRVRLMRGAVKLAGTDERVRRRLHGAFLRAILIENGEVPQAPGPPLPNPEAVRAAIEAEVDASPWEDEGQYVSGCREKEE